jgi:8-hydroxy-5-deazaflavin:NADPH oxidoreductase
MRSLKASVAAQHEVCRTLLRRVIFISGDDGGAKGEVSVLLKGLGFAVIDLGSLSEGGRAQQVGNGLAGVDLVQFED